MRAVAAVFGNRRPLVLEHPNPRLAGVNHGLDSDHHAFPQLRTAPGVAIVGDLWLFVQAGTDAMAHKFAHYAEASSLDVLLHRRAHISDAIANARLLDAAIKRVTRHAEQLAHPGVEFLAHADGKCRIGVVAVQHYAAIDGDNVARLQLALFRWDAMHHFGINRCAKNAGIIEVSLKSGLGSALLNL